MICLTIAAAAVWLGPVFLPKPLEIFAAHRTALSIVCYGLLGVMLSLYVISIGDIRWPAIPIGAALGYLSGMLGQHITMLILEPVHWTYLMTHNDWASIAQGAMSTLAVSLVLGIWLSGAVAGALILAFERVLALRRH